MEIMPNSIRWLAEDVIHLIELVRQDEAIYNARHMNYFCRPYVENFWREIDLKLGKNSGSSLAKWTNLRISFRREYQIYLTEKVPPSWIFFEKMLFLSPFLRKKRQQIEGIEPHIQEALEQISSITRGNYKSFVESIERCSGSTESVTGDEHRSPDHEEEILWDDNSIKEESIEESNEHDDEIIERFDNDNVEILSDRSSISVNLIKQNNVEDLQRKQQQHERNNNLKRLHNTTNEQNFNNEKRLQLDENNSKRFSSSMLTVRNLQSKINNEPKIVLNATIESNNGIIGSGNGIGNVSNENINKNFEKNFDLQHIQQQYQQGRCSRSSTTSHGIDYSNGRKDEQRNDVEQKTLLITDSNGNCNCKKDPDGMFLMSLLPDIQSLSRKDRGKLKIEIQKVVQDFLYPD